MQVQSGARVPVIVSVVVMAMLAALVATAPVAVAQQDPGPDGPAPTEVTAAAAEWLVGLYDAGSVQSPGGLADLIFALAGAEAGGQDTIASATADLQAAASAYVDSGSELDEGPLGKALLGITVGGGQAPEVERELRDLMVVDGQDAGRFGDAGPFIQSLAVMALQAGESGAPAESLAWLASRRCPDGGFTFGLAEQDGVSVPCDASGEGDLDTTALTIQALLGTGGTDADSRDGAASWLPDQQADDGSFDDNANSSGLSAQALRSVGMTDAADQAADFIATLQIPAGQDDAGAIRFKADDDGSLFLATSQGILAFGAGALQMLGTANGQGACAGTEGVTVVVDLTFFQDGEILQGCAVGDPATGLEALRSAGFDIITQQSDFGEFVCAIEGLPELACDQPFEGQFWGYSQGEPDGSWTAYEVGADVNDPVPGIPEGWKYGEGEGPGIPAPYTAGPSVVERFAADNRITTAIEISKAGFANGAAQTVLLTRADDFADALAGTPLATALGGPLLTTPSDALPQVVAAEIQRVSPDDGVVHVLGGTAAISQSVVDQIQTLGYTVVRVAGEDRINTAIEVAGLLGDPSQLLITTGYDFPDALAAGTAAAAIGDAAVLLTTSATPHPAVDAYLADHPDATAFALGGPAAAAYPDATPVVGTSREETAVAVAQQFFTAPGVVGIARRDDFADALAGGVDAATRGAPLLITSTGSLAAEVQDYLCANPSVESAVVYGGENAVSAPTADAVAVAIAGSSCP